MRAAPDGGTVADVQPVYNFLGDTYNFYNSRWTRDSVNGAGMAMKATVRWCDNATSEPDTATAPVRRTRARSRTPTGARSRRRPSSQMFVGQGVGI